jgi:hypothetical protein
MEVNREHVVLTMDANEDVRTGKMKQFLDNMDNMQDSVVAMHDGSDAPNTQIDWSKPIKGAFATHLVDCIQVDYTASGDGLQGKPPDHHCIWMDVQLQTVFGYPMPPVQKTEFR